ncbi:hypothetical protein BaRGS_00013713, partial [Batillaria attramentaria]
TIGSADVIGNPAQAQGLQLLSSYSEPDKNTPTDSEMTSDTSAGKRAPLSQTF